MSKLFSILIANYNNGKYFKDCYESIIAQTYQNFEVVIVDDASTDDSVELIQNMIAKDDRFVLYQNDSNKGCGYTKRRCVELTKGEWFGFLDPDDALTPNALEVTINKHTELPRCTIVYSRMFLCDANLNITSVQEGNRQVSSHDPYYFNLDGFIAPFAAFKKMYYDQTDGIDPYLQRAVDQDLYAKLYEKGTVYYIDEPLYYYRIHERGISALSVNVDKAFYWFWVVIIATAKRRGLNVEELFLTYFKRRSVEVIPPSKNLTYYLRKFKRIRSWLN